MRAVGVNVQTETSLKTSPSGWDFEGVVLRRASSSQRGETACGSSWSGSSGCLEVPAFLEPSEKLYDEEWWYQHLEDRRCGPASGCAVQEAWFVSRTHVPDRAYSWPSLFSEQRALGCRSFEEAASAGGEPRHTESTDSLTSDTSEVRDEDKLYDEELWSRYLEERRGRASDTAAPPVPLEIGSCSISLQATWDVPHILHV